MRRVATRTPTGNAIVSEAAMEDDADLDVGADDFEQDRKKLSGKKIVVFFILPLLLIGGAAVGIMMSGSLGGGKDEAKPAEEAKAPAPVQTVFYDLPEMLVNLNTTGRRPSYLKVQVSLEVDNNVDVTRLQALSPRIVDNFQVYLRELRIDDLRGSAGLYRLREELLARVNVTVQPIKVKNVLFKEILVQ